MRVELTRLSRTAGCAAKIAQADLMEALAHLPRSDDPRVLVGPETSDDAAVIRLSEELGLVETVDVFIVLRVKEIKQRYISYYSADAGRFVA